MLSAEWNSARAELDDGCKSKKGLGSILMLVMGLSVGLPLSCVFIAYFNERKPGDDPVPVAEKDVTAK